MIASCTSSAALHNRRFSSLSPSAGGSAALKFRSRKLCRCVAAAAPLSPRLHPAGGFALPHIALQARPSRPRSTASGTRLHGVVDGIEAGVAAWSELPLVVQGSIRLVRCCSADVVPGSHPHAPHTAIGTEHPHTAPKKTRYVCVRSP